MICGEGLERLTHATPVTRRQKPKPWQKPGSIFERRHGTKTHLSGYKQPREVCVEGLVPVVRTGPTKDKCGVGGRVEFLARLSRFKMAFLRCLNRPPIGSGSGRADSRIRTDDLIITNDLLYQLSYIGILVLSSPPRFPEVAAGPESVIRPLSGRRRKAG
jgi:hypothetical protein